MKHGSPFNYYHLFLDDTAESPRLQRSEQFAMSWSICVKRRCAWQTQVLRHCQYASDVLTFSWGSPFLQVAAANTVLFSHHVFCWTKPEQSQTAGQGTCSPAKVHLVHMCVCTSHHPGQMDAFVVIGVHNFESTFPCITYPLFPLRESTS